MQLEREHLKWHGPVGRDVDAGSVDEIMQLVFEARENQGV